MPGPHSTVLPDAPFVTIPATAGLTADDALPWLIDVDVFEQAVANTNWDLINVDSGALINGYKWSSGDQNALIDFDVVLAAGTWTVEVLTVKNSDQGVISVQFDTVEKGTIDTYVAGSATRNNLSSVAGISVPVTAKIVLRLKMATKNGSSSSYYGRIQHIQLRRTA